MTDIKANINNCIEGQNNILKELCDTFGYVEESIDKQIATSLTFFRGFLEAYHGLGFITEQEMEKEYQWAKQELTMTKVLAM